MAVDYEHERQLLRQLPPSATRDEALRLLDEMEAHREREAKRWADPAIWKRFERDPLEERIFRVLPWVVVAVAAYVVYSGVVAIRAEEYCYMMRRHAVCSHGLRAQLEGGAAVAIGALMALVPLPTSRARILAACMLGPVAAACVVGSLLVH